MACGGRSPEAATSRAASPAPWIPSLVLTAQDSAAIRARIAAGEEPWASAWRELVGRWADPALAQQPQVERGPFTGGIDVHEAFLHLDTDSRAARNLAIAYALSGDLRYAQRAHDFLVAWSRDAEPTRLRDYDSPDTGQLQSWGAFSFAYAYDLTRGHGLYSPEESAAVQDYFTRFTVALREAADRLAADPSIGTDLRLPYEWSPKLTYRFEDRVIGGTFAMALDLA